VEVKDKYFFDKVWLKVKRAIPPELIIWENIGLSNKSKRIKVVIISLLSFLLFISLFVVVLFLESQGQIAEDKKDS
jgi:hypothetical protein